MTDTKQQIEWLIEYAKSKEDGYYIPEYASKFNPEFMVKLLESWSEMRNALKQYAANGRDGMTVSDVSIVPSGEIAIEALAKADEVFE